MTTSPFPPAMSELIRDPVIAAYPHAIRVYVFLAGELGFTEPFTPVKAWLLADELSASKQTVLRALDLLTERGFLREGPREPNNGPRTFHLEWVRRSGGLQNAPARVG